MVKNKDNIIEVNKQIYWEPVKSDRAPWPIVGADKYRISPYHESFDLNFNTLFFNSVDLNDVS